MSDTGTTFDANEPIGSRALDEAFATELYDFCRRLDEAEGLNNGECALFWHLDAVIGSHLKKANDKL